MCLILGDPGGNQKGGVQTMEKNFGTAFSFQNFSCCINCPSPPLTAAPGSPRRILLLVSDFPTDFHSPQVVVQDKLGFSFFYQVTFTQPFCVYSFILSHQVQHWKWLPWHCQVIQKKRRLSGEICAGHCVARWDSHYDISWLLDVPCLFIF